jgi:hypothetical protein
VVGCRDCSVGGALVLVALGAGELVVASGGARLPVQTVLVSPDDVIEGLTD